MLISRLYRTDFKSVHRSPSSSASHLCAVVSQTVHRRCLSYTGHLQQRRPLAHHHPWLYQLLSCPREQPLRRRRHKVRLLLSPISVPSHRLRANANAALIFEYSYRFISIAKSYFGKVDEESVKNNFVLIYELIDGMPDHPTHSVHVLSSRSEIIDFGYPQNSETDTLKTYITTESIISSAYAAVMPAIPPRLSLIPSPGRVFQDHHAGHRHHELATGRRQVQKERSVRRRRGNDQLEHERQGSVSPCCGRSSLDVFSGTVLRSDVDGHIQMRAYLTGTPECKFGLNDKLVIDKNDRGASDAIELDDCRFHQCVRLNEFDTSRTISFIPPDGEFELMRSVLWLRRPELTCSHRYRATSNVKIPLRVIPTVNEVGTRQVTYSVTVRASFDSKLSATNVVLKIPTPLNTATVDCKVATGKAKYVPAENVAVWKCVGRRPGCVDV